MRGGQQQRNEQDECQGQEPVHDGSLPAAMRPKSALKGPNFDSWEQKSIDDLYGLEPVFEPGAASAGVTQFVAVQCPYCGERWDTAVDLSAGSFRYVEDCQVCCQPIELTGEVDENGALLGLTAGQA